MKTKISYFLFIGVLFTSLNLYAQKAEDPIIMTIDGNKVTKSEFLRVYLKNNDNPKYDKESLDEYMVLFKHFKLKVAEAHHLKYDTIPSLKQELKGYYNQLAKPYLIDSSKTNELIAEAYSRMEQEIRASHILIKLEPNPSPEDTLKAYNKALEIKKQIEDGKDFALAAASSSEDPSARTNMGDLGFFTVFQMVYPFETAAYNLKEGEISAPIRTNYGYHIVKKTGTRPARGTITTAHIMVALQKNPNTEDLQKAKEKIDDIYKQLEEGKEFSRMAALYSDDQGSKNNGGQLPAFGTGTTQRMVSVFEDKAFALKNNGDYSEPFQTEYGFHIVQRIEYKPLESFENLKKEISQKIKSGDRGKITEKSFINKLKIENGYSDLSSNNISWFYQNIDSTIYDRKSWQMPSIKKDKSLIKYNNKTYSMSDFLNYIARQRQRQYPSIKELIDENFDRWVSSTIMEDEKSHLKERYPSYQALIQEYEDGVLLYEIMKDKVWDRAIKDTLGLQNFFESNSNKYQWPDRIDAIIYSSQKAEFLEEVKLLSKNDTLSVNKILNKVNADSQLNVTVKQGKYVQNELNSLKGKTLVSGENPIYKDGDIYYFIFINDFIPAGPKELREVRGEVIQEYQKYLESNWLEELDKKHKITIDKEVLYSLGK